MGMKENVIDVYVANKYAQGIVQGKTIYDEWMCQKCKNHLKFAKNF